MKQIKDIKYEYKSNDGCIGADMTYNHAHRCIVDFIENILEISKDELTFTLNHTAEAYVVTFYQMVGDIGKEIIRVISPHAFDNTCFLIRGFAKKRFIEYLKTNNVDYENFPI